MHSGFAPKRRLLQPRRAAPQLRLRLLPVVLLAWACVGAVTAVPEEELHALLALFNSTGGPHWTPGAQPGWASGDNPCTWSGVKCSSGQSHVVSLALNPNPGASGVLPPEMTHLSKLQNL